KGDLQIAELLPVEHVREQIDAELVEHALDVLDRELRVPAVVDVDGEGAQAVRLDEMGDVGAVDAAADADDAVVLAAASRQLDPLDQRRDRLLPRLAAQDPRPDQAIVATAVMAQPGRVEFDRAIRDRVHDAARADLVRTRAVAVHDWNNASSSRY